MDMRVTLFLNCPDVDNDELAIALKYEPRITEIARKGKNLAVTINVEDDRGTESALVGVVLTLRTVLTKMGAKNTRIAIATEGFSGNAS